MARKFDTHMHLPLRWQLKAENMKREKRFFMFDSDSKVAGWLATQSIRDPAQEYPRRTACTRSTRITGMSFMNELFPPKETKRTNQALRASHRKALLVGNFYVFIRLGTETVS